MMTSSTALALRRSHDRLFALDALLSRRSGPDAPRIARRRELVEALWNEQPWPVQDPGAPVTVEATELDPASFRALSGQYRRPVVIRGLGAQTQAVQQWTPSSLAHRMGPAPCVVVRMDEARMAERSHTGGRELQELPFDELVARFEDEPLYLHNSTAFATQRPELLAELGLEQLVQGVAAADDGWDGLFATNLFLGGPLVFSSLHCAPGGNFFLQVYGKKTWTLVDPALSPYLSPLDSRPFSHALSAYGSYRAQRDDPEHVLHRLPRLEVTLEPGDMLYNPPWWWHEVVNHGPTIAVAMRHLPSPLQPCPSWANNRLYSALSSYPLLRMFGAWNWARYRTLGKVGSMRSTLNPRLSDQLDRARAERQ